MIYMILMMNEDKCKIMINTDCKYDFYRI